MALWGTEYEHYNIYGFFVGLGEFSDMGELSHYEDCNH